MDPGIGIFGHNTYYVRTCIRNTCSHNTYFITRIKPRSRCRLPLGRIECAIHCRDMLDSATHSAPDSEAAAEDHGGHPLFPRPDTETGRDPRKFDLIQIIRYNRDGTREICPRTWKGSELRSWQQILDEYGGDCSYQLAAQCGTTHRYTAWSEKWFFASPPRKPFGNGPIGGSARQESPPQYQPQSTSSDVLVQMNLALLKLIMDRREVPQPNPVEMLREAAALLNGGNRAPNPLEIVKEILPMINSGERTSRTLMQGIELARELYKNNQTTATSAPARSNSDDIGDIMNMVKMITAVRPAAPPAPAPAAAPSPAPAPPQQNAFAPPCAPPPGYGWMFTQQGWVAFPIAMPAHPAPSAYRPAPMPAPAPAPRPADDDAWLRAMLAHPETRAKLQSILAATSAPVPAPTPPAPVVAPPVPAPVQAAVQAPVMASAVPAPAPATSAVAAPPPEQAAGDAFTIPPDVPLDDELRAMLAEPEFQSLASSLVPPEAQGAFAQLVQQNALQLRGAEE